MSFVFRLLNSLSRLNVDALKRPIPKDMLQHQWIVFAMKQEVHMARWMRTVWGWPKARRSRDESEFPSLDLFGF